MPVLKSSYIPPALLKNGHAQTLFAGLCRRIRGVHYKRERISTPDGDFLDLDWSRVGSKKLAILSHGLEGDSNQPYVLGMVRALNRRGWDALAWNFRGCSGEPNRLVRSYHSGATEDLEAVLQYARRDKKHYQEVALIGFSLGGNLTLKYLGEQGSQVDPVIRRAVAFSVPCHLEAGAHHLAKGENLIYMVRFLIMLRSKINHKRRLMPGPIPAWELAKIRSFLEFDNIYTAPMNGFRDARDYWTQCSCDNVLDKIRVPTLLVNAKNDPFLPKKCHPVAKAEKNPKLFFEMPESGGHVGFVSFNRTGEYWSEKRAMDFLNPS